MENQKKCFVIMPFSNHPDYEVNHFKFVYEDIIKPAIIGTNLIPIRADGRNGTQLIQADIIKNCVESDMAICDISSKNPNVMFELGIRQAFSKPTLIIKDYKTENVFDITGLRYIEYDEKLSYRGVLKAINDIISGIEDTLNPQEGDINSLMKLVELQSASISKSLSKDEISHFLDTTLNKLVKKIDNLENRFIHNGVNQSINIDEKLFHVYIIVKNKNDDDIIKPFHIYTSYTENVQDFFDNLWHELRVRKVFIEAYTYDKNWKCIHTRTQKKIDKHQINDGNDIRNLHTLDLVNGDILKVIVYEQEII